MCGWCAIICAPSVRRSGIKSSTRASAAIPRQTAQNASRATYDGLELPVNAVGEEEFGRNMRAICEKMKGKRAFVLSPYYLERNRTDEMRAMTERYAAIARKTAEEYGFVYIDVQADFDEYMKSRPGQSISWDRVHPGEVGSMILARAVLRALLA